MIFKSFTEVCRVSVRCSCKSRVTIRVANVKLYSGYRGCCRVRVADFMLEGLGLRACF